MADTQTNRSERMRSEFGGAHLCCEFISGSRATVASVRDGLLSVRGSAGGEGVPREDPAARQAGVDRGGAAREDDGAGPPRRRLRPPQPHRDRLLRPPLPGQLQPDGN